MKFTSEQNSYLARTMRQAGNKRLDGWQDTKQAVTATMSKGRTFEEAVHDVVGQRPAPSPTRATKSDAFQSLWDSADKAGKAAAEAKVPVPMYVGTPTHPLGNDIDPSKPIYHVPDGVCGFAWVKWKGNTSWGRWTAKQGYARKAYGGGLSFWIGDYGQSMERKEAYAHAFASVLRENGISDAYAESRMD